MVARSHFDGGGPGSGEGGGWLQETLGHRGKKERNNLIARADLDGGGEQETQSQSRGTKERKEPWFARAHLDGGGEQETQRHREKREKRPLVCTR